MALPTQQLTLFIDEQNSAKTGTRFTVRLDRDSHYQGEDVPTYRGEMLNDTDPVVLNIFPNVLLNDASEYIVSAHNELGHLLWRKALVMPVADSDFWALLGGEPSNNFDRSVAPDLFFNASFVGDKFDSDIITQQTRDKLVRGALVKVYVSNHPLNKGVYSAEGEDLGSLAGREYYYLYQHGIGQFVPEGVYWGGVIQQMSVGKGRAGIIQIVGTVETLKELPLPELSPVPSFAYSEGSLSNTINKGITHSVDIEGWSRLGPSATGGSSPGEYSYGVIRIDMDESVSAPSPSHKRIMYNNTPSNQVLNPVIPTFDLSPNDFDSTSLYFVGQLSAERRSFYAYNVNVSSAINAGNLSTIEAADDLPLIVTGEWQ